MLPQDYPSIKKYFFKCDRNQLLVLLAFLIEGLKKLPTAAVQSWGWCHCLSSSSAPTQMVPNSLIVTTPQWEPLEQQASIFLGSLITVAYSKTTASKVCKEAKSLILCSKAQSSPQSHLIPNEGTNSWSCGKAENKNSQGQHNKGAVELVTPNDSSK